VVGDQLGLIDGGGFSRAIGSLNDDFGVLGYLIVGVFIVAWLVLTRNYHLNRYDEVEASSG
jgi:nickel/cobalt transporter (NiCoT) family protein